MVDDSLNTPSLHLFERPFSGAQLRTLGHPTTAR
jgi:hypothetical protein